MSKENTSIAIKKYANRRLYHTGTSTYVTLDDLASMVKRGENFIVTDAKSGEDITRSVLTQIIFEQESKNGQNLLPVNFLRQLIGFYGDSMQSLVPSYLEYSIRSFTENQQKLRDQFAGTFGGSVFGAMEEQAQKNMAMFRDAMSMFAPFAVANAEEAKRGAAVKSEKADKPAEDLDGLKRELAEMQKRLDKLSGR
jgi:polyhydroxyalkanoate synthesis repressor PhaR